MSVPRPAMLVAIVTAELPHLDGRDVRGKPACAIISASRRAASGLALSTSTLTPLQVNLKSKYCSGARSRPPEDMDQLSSYDIG